jgi:hypothetical protein
MVRVEKILQKLTDSDHSTRMAHPIPPGLDGGPFSKPIGSENHPPFMSLFDNDVVSEDAVGCKSLAHDSSLDVKSRLPPQALSSTHKSVLHHAEPSIIRLTTSA